MYFESCVCGWDGVVGAISPSLVWYIRTVEEVGTDGTPECLLQSFLGMNAVLRTNGVDERLQCTATVDTSNFFTRTKADWTVSSCFGLPCYGMIRDAE